MTMDRYFSGIMGVLYGDRDPSEAIAEIEEDGAGSDVDEEDLDDMDFGAGDEEEDEGNGFGGGPETGTKPPDGTPPS